MKVNKIILSILFISLSTLSCKKTETAEKANAKAENSDVSACDCAHMFDEYDGLMSGGKKEWDWEYAKKCAKKYGNISKETENILNSEIDVQTFRHFAGRAVLENSLEECNDNREFSKAEKEKACDCYENSASVLGAYDNLNAQQKIVRDDCNKIFAGYQDENLKKLCEENPD